VNIVLTPLRLNLCTAARRHANPEPPLPVSSEHSVSATIENLPSCSLGSWGTPWEVSQILAGKFMFIRQVSSSERFSSVITISRTEALFDRIARRHEQRDYFPNFVPLI
jgi:hypothetical protein